MNVKKILCTSLGLNLLQIILIIITITLVGRENQNSIRSIIVGVVSLSIVNIMITAGGYIYLQKVQYKNLLASMKDLEKLNLTLRVQRHDYLNQIQVVHGLLEMEEYEEAKSYMESVFKEITKVGRALKTAQPAINALLQAKLQVAESQGIDMYLDIRTDLRGLMIEPWELCKVLANIIDNAMTALKQNEGSREIRLCMEQTEEKYIFKIANNGPKISEAQYKLIFNEGYTTKKESGHGMGLYIVKNVIKEAKGSLEVESNNNWTVFTIKLPKNKSYYLGTRGEKELV